MKILQLSYVTTWDCDSLSRLVSGCPVLESFHLENCRPINRGKRGIIEAYLPLLKNMKIVHYTGWGYPICPVVIEAPNLEDLHLEHFAQLKFNGSSPLPCLHSAHVGRGVKCQSSYHDLITLLAAISNAKRIFLSATLLCRLSFLRDVQFPVFPNLKHLTIGNGGRSGVLHTLLSSASKLHTLVIDMENHPEQNQTGPMMWERIETARTPECLLSSLEVIDIKGPVEFKDDWQVIVYLVNSGGVLKKVNMHIYSWDDEIMGRRYLELLLKQSRGPTHWQARLLLPNNEEIRVIKRKGVVSKLFSRLLIK